MKRALIITVAVIAIVGVLGGIVYAFGTPSTPGATAASGEAGVSPSSVTPAVDGAAVEAAQPGQADPVAITDGAEVPPADPSAPLAIEIPGCVCHSKDQKLVDQHAAYRMNQCAGCHAGETPTGR